MRTQIIWLAGALAIGGLGGAIVMSTHNAAPDAAVSGGTIPRTPESASMLSPANPNVVAPRPHPRRYELTYYTLRETADDIRLVPHVTSVSASGTPSMWRQAHVALDAMEAARGAGGERNPLPDGAHVLGVHIVNGLATVNLNRAFQDNFNGGAREEQMTVYAIVNTVAGVKGVNSVAFQVDGKPISDLGGHIDLSEPLTPDYSLVERAS